MKIVYKCNYISYSMPVTVNGVSQRLTFKGGTYGGGMTVNARFITNDKALQEEIESSAAFKSGQIWVSGKFPEAADNVIPMENIVNDVALNEIKPEPVLTQTESTEVTQNANQTDVAKDATDVVAALADTVNQSGATDIIASDKVEEGITGFQKAKNLLVSKYAVTFEANVTKAIVLEKAKELGVTFPNWK